MNYSTSRTHRSRKKTHGLALLEILIAIGILGLIAAGVASLASRTFEEQNANKINTDIIDIALSVQKAYKRQATYAATDNNNTQDLIDANVVSATVASNPVTNGLYDFYVANRQAADADDADDAFIIGIDGLNSSLCTTIVTGGLLDDAVYLEVLATGGDGTGKLFNADPDWGGDEGYGVVKSSAGVNEFIEDPLQAANVCQNTTNKVLVGFY